MPKAELLLKSNQTRMSYFKQLKIIWKKTTKNSFKILAINYSIQLVLCSFILYMQQRQFIDTVQPLNFTQTEINGIKNSTN